MRTVVGLSGSPQNIACEVLALIDGVAVIQLTGHRYMAREFFRQVVPGTRVRVAEEAGPGFTGNGGLRTLIEGRVVIGDPDDLLLQVED